MDLERFLPYLIDRDPHRPRGRFAGMMALMVLSAVVLQKDYGWNASYSVAVPMLALCFLLLMYSFIIDYREGDLRHRMLNFLSRVSFLCGQVFR